MLGKYLENVRKNHPLIHNITNYVTANDCANILLACGASPIMADSAEETAEITEKCAGLAINLGTLRKDVIPSMLAAGKKSNELMHPVLLDPVGAGASEFRTKTALLLLRELSFRVIRGNASEINTLAAGTGSTRGVDADQTDIVTASNIDSTIAKAKGLARMTGAVVVITGEIDLVVNKSRAYSIRNGHPMMGKVTGSGCMLSSLITAFISANPDSIFEAVVAAVCTMGLCGEVAAGRMQGQDGNASYRNYMIDAVYNIVPEELELGARYSTEIGEA